MLIAIDRREADHLFSGIVIETGYFESANSNRLPSSGK
jgi:nanoRNase/pAp phosphatase (c-di-AMP/oligoRNAs hydrolase)